MRIYILNPSWSLSHCPEPLLLAGLGLETWRPHSITEESSVATMLMMWDSAVSLTAVEYLGWLPKFRWQRELPGAQIRHSRVRCVRQDSCGFNGWCMCDNRRQYCQHIQFWGHINKDLKSKTGRCCSQGIWQSGHSLQTNTCELKGLPRVARVITVYPREIIQEWGWFS